MDLAVFRQAHKVRPDGRTIYKGEDTLPFVNEHILLVADGLGGAAAIRHQSFNRDMFDSEKLFDVLFKDVLEDADEDIQTYVVRSYYEFLSIADCYFDNINNIKKSGYFGSRIVSAIFLYLAQKFIADRLSKFETEFSALPDEEAKNTWLEKIGEQFTRQLKSMLLKASENANLVYESSFSGLALLGTTLCAVITDEKEDHVDALYFVAGDSRPYLWSEAGLQQVTADQERTDGGMTNFIKANGDFKIECKFFRFKKPCVLINASDGIFDSKKFKISQMAFEKLLAECIRDSGNIEEVGRKLEAFFEENGTHDDSSTIALKTFGYKDFNELQDLAGRRLEQIMRSLQEMNDLLDRNYSEESEQFEDRRNLTKKKLFRALWELPTVERYCKNRVREKIYLGEIISEKFAEEYAEAENSAAADKSELEKKECELLQYIRDKVIGTALEHENDFVGADADREVGSNDCRQLLDRLVSGSSEVAALQISAETANVLQYRLDEYKNLCEQVQADDEAQGRLLLREAETAWLEICSQESDILNFALDRKLITNADRERFLEQYFIGDDAEGHELEEKAKIQNALLDAYNKTYFALIQRG